MTRFGWRPLSLRSKVMLAVAIPLILLAASGGAMIVDRVGDIEVDNENLEVISPLSVTVKISNSLGRGHLHLVQGITLEPNLRRQHTPEDAEKALGELRKMLEGRENVEPGLLAAVDEASRGIEAAHRSLTHEVTTSSPAVSEHSHYLQVSIAAASALAPRSTSAEASAAFRHLTDVLDLWPALLAEDLAISEYLAQPDSATRLAAQPAVQVLQGMVELLNASSTAMDGFTLATETWSDMNGAVMEGVFPAEPLATATWFASQETRATILENATTTALAQYVYALQVRKDDHRRELVAVATGMIVLVAAAYLMTSRLTSSISGRLQGLEDAASDVVEGKFAPPSERRVGDEIDQVFGAFDAVNDRVRSFSSEAARLSESVVLGQETARVDVTQYSGEWRTMLSGLNLIVEQHLKTQHDLRSESSRLTSLEKLARSCSTSSSLISVLDDNIGLILTATEARQVEYWEVTSAASITLRSSTSALESPANPISSSATLAAFEPLSLHDSGTFENALVAPIRNAERQVGTIVVLDSRDSGSAESVMTSVSAFLSSLALREQRAPELARDALVTSNGVSLPNAADFREKLSEALTRWRNASEDFLVVRAMIKTTSSAEHQDLVSDPATLQYLGQLMVDGLTDREYLAHLGGLEFGVLTPVDTDTHARVARATSRLTRHNVEGQMSGMTMVAGLAFASDVPMASVDAMMLAARQAARSASYEQNAVRFDPQLGRQVTEESRLRNRLRSDLLAGLEGPIRAAYQPIVSLSEGRVTDVEALARWNPPTLGPVPPTRFITMAEELDLVGDLDSLVARRAMSELSQPGYDSLGLYVNVSAAHLAQRRHAWELLELAEQLSFPPTRLGIELTETAMLVDSDFEIVTQLEALRRAGCAVAVDDFGTGHASFSYLTDLPVTRVKIDRAFVTNVHQRPEAMKVLQTMVALSHDLGMKVVAEGIETEAELACVIEAGCDHGQGYLFARPVDPDVLCQTIDRLNVGVPRLLGLPSSFSNDALRSQREDFALDDLSTDQPPLESRAAGS